MVGGPPCLPVSSAGMQCSHSSSAASHPPPHLPLPFHFRVTHPLPLKAPSLTPCLPQLSITDAQTCIPAFSISSIKSLLHWPCLMPSVHFIPCQCGVYLKASCWHCDCLLASASPKARFRNTGSTGGWQQKPAEKLGLGPSQVVS